MKSLLVILILSTNSYAGSFSYGDSYLFQSGSSTLTSGLNPSTHEPLGDSDWLVSYSAPNAGSCNEFSTTGYIYNDGSVALLDIQYVPTTNSTCTGLSVVGDVSHSASFFSVGIVQETFFNSESITCSDTGSCAVNLNLELSNQKFAHFAPTNGENGTNSGVVNSFLYNYKTLNFSSSDGTGGNAGTPDMSTPSSSTKYCVYKRDRTSDGSSSAFAKDPEIKIKKINWTPYTQGAAGSTGTSVTSSSGKSYVIKGLDYSQIYWLGQDNILDFGL